VAGEIGATPEARDAFSIEIATAWEQAFFAAPAPHTRKAALRTAIVLGRDAENMTTILRRLTRLGLGGRMGSGRQYVSWIHALDFCRGVEFVLEHDALHGPVNLAAPHPVTNGEMMRMFRGLLHVPVGLPAPRAALELGAVLLRTETELVLKSRRVISRKLPAAGFRFRFEKMDAALADLLSREGRHPVCAPPVLHQ
jgi:uncharacterized protein (TIGR01777 family)